MAIASLVLGIITIIIAFVPFCGSFAFIPAVIGLVLGVIFFVQADKKKEKKGLSIAGIILSSLALVFSIIWSLAIAGLISYLDIQDLDSKLFQDATISTTINTFE